jgi:hypothetical protein
MKTPSHCQAPRSEPLFSAGAALVASLLFSVLSLTALAKDKNPASKIYVSDVSGEATIATEDTLDDLTKRSVYSAQGTVIETKTPDNDNNRSKYFSTMVYSNGTGAFFDADTKVEIKQFMQEPFQPNRNDADAEPSISQTQAVLSRGTIGLCNSKLVAGSNMGYQTPQASVSIRGRKLVIEASGDVTKVSMLEGDSTVKGGSQDTSGVQLKTGQQAIIRRGAPGQPNQVEVIDIPKAEMPQLDDKVAMACMAKKTVYFEVKERTYDSRVGSGTSKGSTSGDNAGSNGDSKGSPDRGGITAFDGNSGGASSVTVREIVPVEVVPSKLPVENTISPARLITSTASSK